MSSGTGSAFARLGIAIGGALIASLIPGAGPIVVGLGFTLGSVVGNLLIPAGGNQTVDGPRLSDLNVTSSAPGRPIPILYGTMRMGGNVIWSPGITEIRQEETVEQGKGGGASMTTVSYRYTADFAVALCEGPADIIKIFADSKLVADWTGAGPTTSAATSGSITRFQGTETQEPSSVIQADKAVADTPAYRGLCYAVFDDLPLEDYGNRIPQITAVVSTNASASSPKATLSPGYGLFKVVWSANNQIFYSFDSKTGVDMVAIHAPSQTVLLVGDYQRAGPFGSSLNLPGIDNENNLYWAEREALGLETLIKYDGETFAILGSTKVTFSGGFSQGALPQIRNVIVMGKAPATQRVAVLGSADTITIVDPVPLSDTDNGRGRLILPILNTIELDVLYGGGWATKDATTDDDGFCWVLATEAGSPSDGARVTKLNPSTGEPVESYTIAGQENASFISYESSTNSLLIAGADAKVVRWDIDTQTIEATSPTLVSVGQNHVYRAGPYGGSLWIGKDDDEFIELDAVNLTILRTLDNSSWGAPLTGNPTIYDQISHAVLRYDAFSGDTEIYWLYLDRLSGAGVTLRSIVEDISSLVGLTGSDVDASELTDTVHGYGVSNRMSARRAIEPLMGAYFFDGIESDWVAKFPKRGQTAVAALTEDDLGARPSAAEIVPFLTEARTQEVELPLQIEVSYADASIDYQINTQHAQRTAEAVDTSRKVAVELPIAFADNGEPAQIAEKMLYLAWQNRAKYTLSFGLKHARLDPTDVITATTDGAIHTVLLDEPSLGANGVIEARGVSEDVAVYTSQAAGQDADGFEAQSIIVAGAFLFQLVDTPLLRDQDDGQIFYMAAGAYGSDIFPGVVVYRSTDNVEFTDAAAFISGSTPVGVTSVKLASGTYTVFDRTNAVTLRLFSGTLSSSTEALIVGDEAVNAILIGDELLQFVTATLNADGTYTLSTLLRGRRGTEWAVGAHATVERVVVPALTMIRYAAGITDLDVERFYRAVPIGGSLSNAVNRTLTWTGRSLMPYAPVHITGSRDASPTDWLIQWERRTRVAGAWKDFVDVPVGETVEDYEIDILDSPGSPQTDVVRTITTTISAGGSIIDVANVQATYSDADQITDFGSIQDSVSINIYQLSAVVGRGFAGSATLTLDS